MPPGDGAWRGEDGFATCVGLIFRAGVLDARRLRVIGTGLRNVWSDDSCMRSSTLSALHSSSTADAFFSLLAPSIKSGFFALENMFLPGEASVLFRRGAPDGERIAAFAAALRSRKGVRDAICWILNFESNLPRLASSSTLTTSFLFLFPNFRGLSDVASVRDMSQLERQLQADLHALKTEAGRKHPKVD
jgi:hypothetical protein